MSPAAIQPDSLLARLRGLTAAERAAAVRGEPDADGAIRVLSDELRALMLSDLAGAMDAADWIVALADEIGSRGARLAARTAASTTMAYANRFDSAMSHLDEADRLAEELNDCGALARIALTRVQPLARVGRLDEAIASASRAVTLAQASGDAVLAAKAHSNLGVIHRMRDDPVSALSHFDVALPTLEGDAVARAQIQSNRAEALLELAEFARAEEAFRDAWGAFEKAGMARAAAITEGNLADLLGRQGRFQAALAHFEHAREVMERGEAPGDAARLLAERAEVLLQVGLLDEACVGFRRAVALLDAHALPRESARARMALGRALAHARQHDEALRVLGEASRGVRELGLALGPARVASAYAGVLGASGRFDEALRTLDETDPGAAAPPVDRVSLELARAQALLGVGRADDARACADAANKIARGAGLESLRVEALTLLGRAAGQSGDDALAVAHLEEAASLVERLRGSLAGDRLRVAWQGGHAGIYEQLIAIELDRARHDNAERVLELVERSRSRSLLDMLRGGVELAEQVVASGAGTVVERRLMESLARRQGEVNAIYSRMTARLGDDATAPRHARLVERAGALSLEIAELEGRLASTRRFAGIYGEAPGADAVRARLESGARLVEYFEVLGVVWAVVVSPDRPVRVRRIAPTDSIEHVVERASFQIARGIACADHSGTRGERLAEAARRELRRAYDVLVGPIRQLIEGAGTLVFAPCGGLFRVPFHALHDGAGWLVDRARVAIAPSAGVLCAIEREAPMGDRRRLVMGFADEAAPTIEDEARAVAASVAGQTCTQRSVHAAAPDRAGEIALFTGSDATTENFLRHAPGAASVHVAAHGVFPTGDPLGARLRFADRWLSAREVFSLDLHACAVTLSSCDLGRGTVRGGDELFGFMRAVLAAGARSLVTSLWAAHDRSATALMTSMYASPEEAVGDRCGALARAQRELACVTPHPAHWASFAFAGAP